MISKELIRKIINRWMDLVLDDPEATETVLINKIHREFSEQENKTASNFGFAQGPKIHTDYDVNEEYGHE